MNIGRTLLGVTTAAMLTTAIACSSSTGSSSGSAGTDGGATGTDGGGDTREAGADGGQPSAVDGGDAGVAGSTKGSGTVHAVFTVGATMVDTMCEKVKYATFNSLKFWTISCTNVAGDTVSFNDISGTWPTVGDVTATTGFIISMGANNVGLSHTPKTFDFNVSSADAAGHKIAAVATATWDASGSEPAGSLTLTFDLTFAAE